MSKKAGFIGEDYVICRICRRPYKMLSGHVRVHGMSSQEYRAAYGPFCFASLAWRRENSARLRLRSKRKVWESAYVPRTAEEVASDLRRLIGRKPMAHRRLLQVDPTLAKQVYAVFGLWNAALDQQSLPLRKRTWGRRETDEALRRWAGLHSGLSPQEMRFGDYGLYHAASKFHGSIAQAAKALGIRFRSKHRVMTPEEVIAGIRQVRRQGGALSAAKAMQDHPSLFRNGRSRFGTWAEAIKAAGFDYDKLRVHRSWDRESVAVALGRWVKIHGPLSGKAMIRSANALYLAVLRHYGSLGTAARINRLPYQPKQETWSRERVIREIHALKRRGEPLQRSKVIRKHPRLARAGWRYFRSWDRAVVAAGP
ncbi:MAG TPA: MucR family transcriptional regulator [Phycisphaerae bacterium]|nr:MucR family transcriptional regulator [Phycisphaerae bacterium]